MGELWYCMRNSGVGEKYVKVVQDMFEDSETAAGCAISRIDKWVQGGGGITPGISFETLCLLFAVLMDRLTDRSSLCGPFADDIVLCSESKEQVDESSGRKRNEPCPWGRLSSLNNEFELVCRTARLARRLHFIFFFIF